MLMPVCRNRWGSDQVVWTDSATASVLDLEIGMRRDGSNREEEGLLLSHGILQQPICFACKNIGRILAFVADRRILVRLKCAVQI